jgi:hypothetical protein
MFPAFLLPLLGGAGIGAGIGALTGGGDGAWKGALGGGLLGGGLGAAGAFGGAAAAPTPLLSAFGNPAAASVTPNLASLGAAPGGLLGSNSTALAGITPSFSSAAGIQAAALPEFASTGAFGVGGTASALGAITPNTLATSPFLQGLPGITEATPGFLEGLMPSQDTMTKAYLAALVGKSLMPDQQPQQQALPSRATPIIRGAFGAPVAPRQAIFPQPGFMGARSRRRY